MKKFWKLFSIVFLSLAIFSFTQKVKVAAQALPTASSEETSLEADQEKIITVHVFASKTCPHCKDLRQFLTEYKSQHHNLEINFYYFEENVNVKLFQALIPVLEIYSGSVPITVIGDEHIVGFGSSSSTGVKIERLILAAQRNQDYKDWVIDVSKTNNLFPIIDRIQLKEPEIQESPDNTSNQNLTLPFFGDINPSQMSLPILSVVLGLVDGFNPCAMWTLLFLISLLLGMEDKQRMWLLGLTFIIASGVVYFLFMAAWLNFFLFVGMVFWVRVAIGGLAIWAGYSYLKDYVKNKEGSCQVDLGGRKQRVFDKLKEVTYRKQLIWALIGIVLLAFAVNLVELICSAGLPAVFTQILSLSNLAWWQYYSYLFLYILFFMLDDMVVFIIAMKTLHAVGFDSKYSRLSHLIGGVLMLLIGLAMIFKPELLMFS